MTPNTTDSNEFSVSIETIKECHRTTKPMGNAWLFVAAGAIAGIAAGYLSSESDKSFIAEATTQPIALIQK